MAISQKYKKYRDNAVSGMTPSELIALLYEEATVCINKAVIHINNKNICDAHNSIVKTENIVLYLRDSLNMSLPVSKNLASLYDYMYDRLIEANIKKDTEILEYILKMLTELKETWQKAEVLNRTGGRL